MTHRLCDSCGEVYESSIGHHCVRVQLEPIDWGKVVVIVLLAGGCVAFFVFGIDWMIGVLP